MNQAQCKDQFAFTVTYSYVCFPWVLLLVPSRKVIVRELQSLNSRFYPFPWWVSVHTSYARINSLYIYIFSLFFVSHTGCHVGWIHQESSQELILLGVARTNSRSSVQAMVVPSAAFSSLFSSEVWTCLASVAIEAIRQKMQWVCKCFYYIHDWWLKK